jgi:hypothetical protein
MIDWPTLDELKQVLDVESQDWDGAEDSAEGPTRLSRLLEAAIARVKGEVGNWDEDLDFPDANLAQAALRMAELLALRPEVAQATKDDPTYQRLMFGRRRRFGIS